MGVGVIEAATDKQARSEFGLAALVLLLRFNGIGADPEQIRHRFGDEIGVLEMLRCAKEFGLKARTSQIKVATADQYAAAGHSGAARRPLSAPRQGQRRPSSRSRSAFAAAYADVARRLRGDLGRPPDT